ERSRGEDSAGPRAEVLCTEFLAGDFSQVVVDVRRTDRQVLPVIRQVLKQLLAREVSRSLHDACEPGVAYVDLVLLAALTSETKPELRAFDPSVVVTQRRQTVRVVRPCIFLVSNPDVRLL